MGSMEAGQSVLITTGTARREAGMMTIAPDNIIGSVKE